MSVVVTSCLVGLSQLLLTIFWLAKRGLKSLAERLFCLFLLSATAYLTAAAFDLPTWLQYLLVVYYTGAAGFFWLSCSALFNDNYRLKWWHLGLVIATMLLPTLYLISGFKSDVLRIILVILPQGLEYVFIILGLVTTAIYWRDDLVEERRVMRAGTLILVGFYLLGAVGSKHFFGHNNWWLNSGSYLVAAVICILFNLYLGELRQQTLFSPPKTNAKLPPIDESDKLVASLMGAMQEGVYRKMGLTIGQLAEQIDTQEHNLRRLINQQLGYRNFNSFLNSYRIEEAADKLKNGDLAILTIALDAGFGSLTSFNHAFKQRFGMPPSQYRKQALVEPQTD